MKMLPVNPWAATSTSPLGPVPALLLHFEDGNGSTTFADSSPNAIAGVRAEFRIDGPEVSTNQAKFGSSSLFHASRGAIVWTDPALAPGTNDFTADLWYYPTSAANPDCLLIINGSYGDRPAEYRVAFNGNVWRLQAAREAADGGLINSAGAALSFNAWHHVAVTRASGTLRFFLDGVLVDSFADTANISRGIITSGRQSTSNYAPNGYTDELRFINGAAAWTENFTPPTAPYADP